MPEFFFTYHPGDMYRARILPGANIMTVAAAHWDDNRARFKIRRPPADMIGKLAIDSGGFTAAKRWGRYPWTPAQYASFIHEMSRDVPVEWAAVMDYACEPGVNREILSTNLKRIEATIENERACRNAAPDLPWLPVLQGDALAERLYDLKLREKAGLLPGPMAGIGSICGRGIISARETILFYLSHLGPETKYHAFGLHVQALDCLQTRSIIASWDSYSWNWGRGQKDLDRPAEYLRRDEETRSDYVLRLARLYYENTIKPRLETPSQMLLL